MFKLRTDARRFFRGVEGSFGRAPQFDMYYFCAVAGLACKRTVPRLTDYDAGDLVDYFPAEYRHRRGLIIPLLLSTELEREQIDVENRREVHAMASHLLDAHSPSGLSQAGIAALNGYSFAGCDVVRQEWFEAPPNDINFFLLRFSRKLPEETRKVGAPLA